MAELQSYQMEDNQKVAKKASQDIENWLNSLEQTIEVLNVEADPDYQRIDVDLLWQTETANYQVEIKGDRKHATGNFFFETISNNQRQTPGCFMYSEADLFFYYFVEIKMLYIIPLTETREWFIENMDDFRERETSTPVGNGHYITVGRLVPIERVLAEVDGIYQYNLKKFFKQK